MKYLGKRNIVLKNSERAECLYGVSLPDNRHGSYSIIGYITSVKHARTVCIWHKGSHELHVSLQQGSIPLNGEG